MLKKIIFSFYAHQGERAEKENKKVLKTKKNNDFLFLIDFAAFLKKNDFLD
jgi:hypothetical protein